MIPNVVITGLGAVSSTGIDIHIAWRSIESSAPRAVAVELPAVRHQDGEFKVFRAPDYRIGDVVRTAVESAQLEKEGLAEHADLKHLVAVTGLALEDAGLGSVDSIDRTEVGLVVADETSGVERLARTLYTSVAAEPRDPESVYGELADQVFGLNTFLVPFVVARALGIGGECTFVNTACTSGLSAIDGAAAQIRSGRTCVAVAAAADDPYSSGKYRWFADRGLYADDGDLRPFHADAGGTVFGDGGAALVLEDEDHAIRRGARIYGRLLGCGFTQDGWRVSTPDPARDNQARAIRRALDQASVDVDAIEAVVPHGTGIRLVDTYEARTIRRLWPAADGRPICLPLKRFVGHNLGGSALLETALLIALMHEQRMPEVSPSTAASGYPPDLKLPSGWMTSGRIRRAVKTAVGFGGFHGAIVLEAV